VKKIKERGIPLCHTTYHTTHQQSKKGSNTGMIPLRLNDLQARQRQCSKLYTVSFAGGIVMLLHPRELRKG
jgi:hypothetical protein